MGDLGPWRSRHPRAAFALLISLGALTGARTPVIWFKICPALLAAAGARLVASVQ